MNALATLTPPRATRQPLALVLIGGLALHGHITATTIIDRAEAMGLDIDRAARAVLDLIDRGLASVSREGSDGHLAATPALADLERSYRVRGIMAFLAVTKAAPVQADA